jgi:pimeloyl-ACP methyl ester carboxylesterase
MTRLGVTRAMVLGHSWGASVAVALALRSPHLIKGLVLVSGYYYPTPRIDALIFSGPRLPIIGPVISHTIAPLLARAIWPRLTKKIFAPAPVPAKFKKGFPRELAIRPSQLRASAEESALLIPTAAALQRRYHELTVPIGIVAGEDDEVVATASQSARLHHELRQSTFQRVPGNGHMVHQTSTDEILAAVDRTRDTARRVTPHAVISSAAS